MKDLDILKKLLNDNHLNPEEAKRAKKILADLNDKLKSRKVLIYKPQNNE